MDKKYNSTLWINIKKLRLKRGWSQDQLSRRANIPFTTFTKIETGRIKNPSIFTVRRISKALNISIDKLFK